jgi:hypothetical protein
MLTFPVISAAPAGGKSTHHSCLQIVPFRKIFEGIICPNVLPQKKKMFHVLAVFESARAIAAR